MPNWQEIFNQQFDTYNPTDPTMTSPNFSSVLDKPVTSVERPKPIPAGHYVGMIQAQCRFDKSSKKKTDFCEWEVLLVQPMDDVDAEQLAAMGGLNGKKLPLTFYLTDDAGYRLREFLVNTIGCDETDENGEERSMRTMLPEAVGQRFMVEIIHEVQTEDRNGRPLETPAIFSRIGGTAAL